MMINKFFKKVKRYPFRFLTLTLIVILYAFCLPKPLFNVPYATLVEDKNGQILGAIIADDGQWRLPPMDEIPDKFEKCILAFEDRYYYYHPGINPQAILSALKQNWKQGKIVRGGSTLTQQVIRMSRKNPDRNYFEKMIEAILSTRLEVGYSKESILKLYANHAPFGGNVVGLEMAARRYFEKDPHDLSWGEMATLAVLPNAPSLIHPGKNTDLLLEKRNRLLKVLLEDKIIDSVTYEVSLAEELPKAPNLLPMKAQHLVNKIYASHKGQRVRTTIDANFQDRVREIAGAFLRQYEGNLIHNAAVIVVDVNTRDVISYVGNVSMESQHQKDVDIVASYRSTGSVLKPLLYTAMLDEGMLLPTQIIPDVPTQISDYKPQNFDGTYRGGVSADKALSKSLNIPSVLMLKDYGVNNFYDDLQKLKFRGIKEHSDFYGLSLILGGAECTLMELAKVYAGLSGTLNHFVATKKYRENEYVDLNWIADKTVDFGRSFNDKQHWSAASIFTTYTSLKEVNRPDGYEASHFFQREWPIAWKTGTSFGNRDAWAIGTSPQYVVGVWVGNATGEGRPGLTGVSHAAPIMFTVFNQLDMGDWFQQPVDEMTDYIVCKDSGMLASEICPQSTFKSVKLEKHLPVCEYHKLVHVNTDGFRVNAECEISTNYEPMSWFVLPPVMEYYYKMVSASYKSLPPFKPGCGEMSESVMEMIYPQNNHRIKLSRNHYSIVQPVVLKLAHRNRDAIVHWYLDDKLIAVTNRFHEVSLNVIPGKYRLLMIDNKGNQLSRLLEISA